MLYFSCLMARFFIATRKHETTIFQLFQTKKTKETPYFCPFLYRFQRCFGLFGITYQEIVKSVLKWLILMFSNKCFIEQMYVRTIVWLCEIEHLFLCSRVSAIVASRWEFCDSRHIVVDYFSRQSAFGTFSSSICF